MITDEFFRMLADDATRRHELGKPLPPAALQTWQARHKSMRLPDELAAFYQAHNGVRLDVSASETRGAAEVLPLAQTESARTLCNRYFGLGEYPDPPFPRSALVLARDANGDVFLLYDPRQAQYLFFDRDGPHYYTIGDSLGDALDWLKAIFLDDESYADVEARCAKRFPPTPQAPPEEDQYAPTTIPDDDLGENITAAAIQSGKVLFEQASDAVLSAFLESLERQAAGGKHAAYFTHFRSSVHAEQARRRNALPTADPSAGDPGIIGSIPLPPWFRAPWGLMTWTAVAFAHDDRLMFVYVSTRNPPQHADEAPRVEVYELPAVRRVRTFNLPWVKNPRIAAEPSAGRYLMLASVSRPLPITNSFVQRHDTITGELLGEYAISGSAYASEMVITPDGQRLAFAETGYGRQPCRLYDIESGQLLSNFATQKTSYDMVVSRDGRRFVTRDLDAFRLYDQEGKLITKLRAPGPSAERRAMFLPPQAGGHLLVAATEAETRQSRYTVYQPDDGKRLKAIDLGSRRLIGITTSGLLVLLDPQQGEIRLAQHPSLEAVHTLLAPPPALPQQLSPTGRFAVSGPIDQALHVYRLA